MRAHGSATRTVGRPIAEGQGVLAEPHDDYPRLAAVFFISSRKYFLTRATSCSSRILHILCTSASCKATAFAGAAFVWRRTASTSRTLMSTLEGLKKAGELPRLKALYLVTYHCNPTGTTTAAAKKAAALKLLRRYEAVRRSSDLFTGRRPPIASCVLPVKTSRARSQ